MCTSISGRCVLSNYCTNRDSNRGGCAQICRWEFDYLNKDTGSLNASRIFIIYKLSLPFLDIADIL